MRTADMAPAAEPSAVADVTRGRAEVPELAPHHDVARLVQRLACDAYSETPRDR